MCRSPHLAPFPNASSRKHRRKCGANERTRGVMVIMHRESIRKLLAEKRPAINLCVEISVPRNLMIGAG